MLALARSRLGGRLAAWAFARMSFAIPVHRLYDTPTLLAFEHPRPSYRVHILLTPKRAISSLEALGPQDADFLADLFAVVQSLVAERGLSASGYRLIANGGAYQDFPLLHFHLIAD